jgi:hypothetical protein
MDGTWPEPVYFSGSNVVFTPADLVFFVGNNSELGTQNLLGKMLEVTNRSIGDN